MVITETPFCPQFPVCLYYSNWGKKNRKPATSILKEESFFFDSQSCYRFQVSVARPSCEGIKGANLYICGLPKSLTQHELENLFMSCGRIITSRILYDSNTGQQRSPLTFIQFSTFSPKEKGFLLVFVLLKKNFKLPIYLITAWHTYLVLISTSYKICVNTKICMLLLFLDISPVTPHKMLGSYLYTYVISLL